MAKYPIKDLGLENDIYEFGPNGQTSINGQNINKPVEPPKPKSHKARHVLLPLLTLFAGAAIAIPTTLYVQSCNKKQQESAFEQKMLKKAAQAVCTTDCKITLVVPQNQNSTADLKYSKDDATWTNFAPGTSISFKAGDKIYLKGNNPKGFSYLENETKILNQILINEGQLQLAGNLYGLIDDGAQSTPTSIPAYCFYKLFENSTGIYSIDNLTLPSVVSSHIYSQTFKGCTNIKSVPTDFLKVTDLTSAPYAYVGMFMGCCGLESIPSDMFKATKLSEGCYKNMFNGCTSLSSAPDLTVESLENCFQCYNYMFANCSSLKKAPTLSCKTLAEQCCAYMFYNCTNLESAQWALPSPTMAKQCYGHMFDGCSKLTIAPILPAKTLAENCYQSIFANCINLNEITVRFETWQSITTSQWVENVASTGSFICPQNLVEDFGPSRIPTGWTIVKQ